MMDADTQQPKVKDIFEMVGYNIAGGDEHLWTDVFPMGRFLDWEGNFSIVFSAFDQRVYEVTYVNEVEDYELKWVRAEFRDAFNKKSAQYPQSDWEVQFAKDWTVVARDYIATRVQGHPV